jgi:hypothetical protein
VGGCLGWADLLGVHLGHGLADAVGKFALQLGLVDHFVFGVEKSRVQAKRVQ